MSAEFPQAPAKCVSTVVEFDHSLTSPECVINRSLVISTVSWTGTTTQATDRNVVLVDGSKLDMLKKVFGPLYICEKELFVHQSVA